MTPADPILAKYLGELQAILFRGYVTKETDAGHLFRMMRHDDAMLQDKLRQMVAEIRAACQPPQARPAANGAPAATGVKRP